MNLKKYLALIILSVTLFSCEKEEPPTLEDREIQYNIIERGNFVVADNNTINEQYLVFNNKEEWSSFLSELNWKSPGKAEHFTKLNFNFNEKTLLIITAGYDTSCCKEITINKVYRDQGRIYVTFEVGVSTGEEQLTSQSYLLFEVSKS
ncbi:MAG: hypothetical protein ABJ092_14685 [Gillisia sp.]